MTHPLIQKLEKRDRLTEAEREAILPAQSPPRRYAAGACFIREGDRPNESCLVMEGMCGRYNDFEDGRRQISALHITGDFVDLHSLLLKPMDHGIVALTDCIIVTVPHEVLRRITEQFPRLARLLWLSNLIDGAISRQWVVNLGRRSAVARLAHLCCELAVRNEVVGLGDKSRFPMPLSQAVLADVLGLSSVHVNRVVQELRGAGLLDFQRGWGEIKDWDALVRFGDFDPAYLRLGSEPV